MAMIQATPNDEVRESTTGSTTGMEDAVNLLGWPVSAPSLSPSAAVADALIARTSARSDTELGEEDSGNSNDGLSCTSR